MKITKVYDLFKMSEQMFRCPVCCTGMTFRNQNSIVCSNNHCFDLSKHGYINFMPRQNKTKYTKDLFESRRLIFRSGFYNPIKDAIEAVIREFSGKHTNIKILDAGCGEGFFISNLTVANVQPNCAYAVDIQKDSIVLAAKENRNIKWIVGDLSNIPLQSASMDAVLNIFAPANYGEFLRVLTPDGLIIKVIPSSRYLIELRNLISNKQYFNENVFQCFNKNITCLDRKHLDYRMPVTKEQLNSFIKMTPLMFNVDRSTLRLDDIKYISIDVGIIVGKQIMKLL